MDLSAATVSIRCYGDVSQVDQLWAAVPLCRLQAAAPWRTFRWYRGQRHYSGTYWSSTVKDHVIYESRLELARLLYADFDVRVRHIVAQPFLLKAVVDGKIRKHVPDFLLMTRHGAVIVDVKPYGRRDDPAFRLTSGWTRELVEARGWRYELWSEPPAAELANLRFLAGFRRAWLFNSHLLKALAITPLDGMPLGQTARLLPDFPRPQVKAGIFHLLWTSHLVTDLLTPLGPAHTLRRPS
jgi:hypothetical protein